VRLALEKSEKRPQIRTIARSDSRVSIGMPTPLDPKDGIEYPGG
jgi:hypothetical protein